MPYPPAASPAKGDGKPSPYEQVAYAPAVVLSIDVSESSRVTIDCGRTTSLSIVWAAGGYKNGQSC